MKLAELIENKGKPSEAGKRFLVGAALTMCKIMVKEAEAAGFQPSKEDEDSIMSSYLTQCAKHPENDALFTALSGIEAACAVLHELIELEPILHDLETSIQCDKDGFNVTSTGITNASNISGLIEKLRSGGADVNVIPIMDVAPKDRN